MKDHIREQIDKALDDIFEEDAEEAKADLDRIEEERRVAESLLDARLAAGLTQRALAKASGLSATKICRMECGKDADLNFGDVQAYLRGLGTDLRVSFRAPRRRRPPTKRARAPRRAAAMA